MWYGDNRAQEVGSIPRGPQGAGEGAAGLGDRPPSSTGASGATGQEAQSLADLRDSGEIEQDAIVLQTPGVNA